MDMSAAGIAEDEATGSAALRLGQTADLVAVGGYVEMVPTTDFPV